MLTPAAVATLLSWLLGQRGPLSDQPLFDGSSIYLQRVGQPVASSALTLTSRFGAPGLAPITGNVAHMLRDVQAASAERIDTGTWVLPWLLVPGLHFS